MSEWIANVIVLLIGGVVIVGLCDSFGINDVAKELYKTAKAFKELENLVSEGETIRRMVEQTFTRIAFDFDEVQQRARFENGKSGFGIMSEDIKAIMEKRFVELNNELVAAETELKDGVQK